MVGVNASQRNLQEIKDMVGRKASSALLSRDGEARSLGADLIWDHSRSLRRGKVGVGYIVSRLAEGFTVLPGK